MTYEFRYELMYMKNIVKSYMKLGGQRFQMPTPHGPQDNPQHTGIITRHIMTNLRYQ